MLLIALVNVVATKASSLVTLIIGSVVATRAVCVFAEGTVSVIAIGIVCKDRCSVAVAFAVLEGCVLTAIVVRVGVVALKDRVRFVVRLIGEQLVKYYVILLL